MRDQFCVLLIFCILYCYSTCETKLFRFQDIQDKDVFQLDSNCSDLNVYLYRNKKRLIVELPDQWLQLHKTLDDVKLLDCKEAANLGSVAPLAALWTHPYASTVHSDGLYLLLIGSSVDRMMVHETCQHFGAKSYFWGNDSLLDTHKSHYNPPTFCANDYFHLASVQIFGSRSSGPYYHDLKNSERNMFVDTYDRLRLILELYFHDFQRLPDKVAFSSTLWDCSYIEVQQNSVDSYPFANHSRAFAQDITARLHELQQLVGNTVDVGLRTDVWSTRRVQSMHWALKDEDLMHVHNNVVREVAIQQNVTLFDFDKDLWSRYNFNDSFRQEIFADHIHPRNIHLVRATLKLIGLRHSNFLFSPPHRSGLEQLVLAGPQQGLDLWDTLSNSSGLFVKSISSRVMHEVGTLLTEPSSGELFSGSLRALFNDFLVCSVPAQPSVSSPSYHKLIQDYVTFYSAACSCRFSGVSERFLSVSYLSLHSDCVPLSHLQLEAIPVKGTIPNVFEEGTIYNCTLTGELWLIFNRRRWNISGSAQDIQWMRDSVNITSVALTSTTDIHFLLSSVWQEPIPFPPRAFHPLALIRPKCSRAYYFISKGHRFPYRHENKSISLLATENPNVIELDCKLFELLDFLAPLSSLDAFPSSGHADSRASSGETIKERRHPYPATLIKDGVLKGRCFLLN